MPVNPNFTNANATTPYASGIGGSNANIIVASIEFTPALPNGTLSDTLGQGFDPFNGLNLVSVVQKSSLNLGPLQTAGYVEIQEAGNGPSSALYRMHLLSDGITWRQANTGTDFPMMTINPANQTQNLLNLSTINAGGITANAVSLMSSLKGTFPTSFP